MKYIVYGHTSYLDVLKIQTDYIVGKDDITLFLNQNNLNIEDLYSKYNRVIFYNDSDTYAKRLSDCLNNIDSEYFLLIHDIDILLNVNSDVIDKIHSYMVENSIDRVDLKPTQILEGCKVININSDLNLIKQSDPTQYIYNVNPSIWKRETLLKIVNTFPNKTYRTIEDMDVQNFCKEFDIYKLHGNKILKCGYFDCLDIFTFLHISHNNRLLPLNNDFTSIYGQSYSDVAETYIEIVNKYDLKKSNKWIS